MADNKDENEKKGGIVKIAIFVAAGLVLLGIGLGIGALIFGGGSEPDPSAEVSEILDGNKPPAETKKAVVTLWYWVSVSEKPLFDFESSLASVKSKPNLEVNLKVGN